MKSTPPKPDFAAFSGRELALLRRLRSPRQVQDFLDFELAYNPADTCAPALAALRARRAHCLEGALVACAAFALAERPPLLMDLRANERDDDHVIAPFREGGRWGAVALSRFCGLRYREPVYASPAELARSYFEFYYNNRGEKTLREYSLPHDARRLKPGWLAGKKSALYVGRALDALRHFPLIPAAARAGLRRADAGLFAAEVLGAGRSPLAGRAPRPYSRLRLPRALT